MNEKKKTVRRTTNYNTHLYFSLKNRQNKDINDKCSSMQVESNAEHFLLALRENWS